MNSFRTRLTSIDFSICLSLKEKVYATSDRRLDGVEAKLIIGWINLSDEMFHAAVRDVIK